METKRPFTLLEWLDTPPPVRQYITAIEQAIEKLIKHQQETELIHQEAEKQHREMEKHQRELEKRIEKLEARLNKNSKNSNKPPSTDDPFQKGRDKVGRFE